MYETESPEASSSPVKPKEEPETSSHTLINSTVDSSQSEFEEIGSTSSNSSQQVIKANICVEPFFSNHDDFIVPKIRDIEIPDTQEDTHDSHFQVLSTTATDYERSEYSFNSKDNVKLQKNLVKFQDEIFLKIKEGFKDALSYVGKYRFQLNFCTNRVTFELQHYALHWIKAHNLFVNLIGNPRDERPGPSCDAYNLNLENETFR